MDSERMKTCFISQIIREISVKITMRYYLSYIKIASVTHVCTHTHNANKTENKKR